MGFTYNFTFPFQAAANWQFPYVFEVRDSIGNLIRRIGKVVDANLNTRVCQCACLTLKIPTDDPGLEAIGGANEIWVRDYNDALMGMFRVAKRRDLADGSGYYAEIDAYDQTARLQEERVPGFVKNGTLLEIVTTLLGNQTGRPTMTVGTISDTIISLDRRYSNEGLCSFQEVLKALSGTLQTLTHYFLDTDYKFHWIDLENQVYQGRRLSLNSGVTSLVRERDFAKAISRLYPYGGDKGGNQVELSTDPPERSATTGQITRGAQRWLCEATSATTTTVTLKNLVWGADNPQRLIGFENYITQIQAGDEIEIGGKRRLVTGVDFYTSPGYSIITLNKEQTFTYPEYVNVLRNYLESDRWGSVFRRQIVVPYTQFSPFKATVSFDYVQTDDAIASYTATYPGAKTIWFEDQYGVELVSVVNSFNATTGAINATVTLPVSGVQDTIFYLVFAEG